MLFVLDTLHAKLTSINLSISFDARPTAPVFCLAVSGFYLTKLVRKTNTLEGFGGSVSCGRCVRMSNEAHLWALDMLPSTVASPACETRSRIRCTHACVMVREVRETTIKRRNASFQRLLYRSSSSCHFLAWLIARAARFVNMPKTVVGSWNAGISSSRLMHGPCLAFGPCLYACGSHRIEPLQTFGHLSAAPSAAVSSAGRRPFFIKAWTLRHQPKANSLIRADFSWTRGMFQT